MECIEKLPYWNQLTPEQRDRVREKAKIRHFEAGESLYGPCITCLGMIYVLQGEARAYILSPDGREITLFRIPREDYCILSASCVLTHISFDSYIAAAEPTDLLIVPAELFGQLCGENVHVRCFTYELATKRFSSVMFVMQQILFARFDQRLASFLLQEAAKTGTTEIRMTQDQIAQHVNSAREVVSRMLKRFAGEGLIENQRGRITITDPAGLERLCHDMPAP